MRLCNYVLSGAARGVTGHTGGPYDTVPEVVILESLFNHSDKYVPIHFDEAGELSFSCCMILFDIHTYS